ncbi:unnamed protein product, partial [Discosporangium mesarthrocarpum]
GRAASTGSSFRVGVGRRSSLGLEEASQDEGGGGGGEARRPGVSVCRDVLRDVGSLLAYTKARSGQPVEALGTMEDATHLRYPVGGSSSSGNAAISTSLIPSVLVASPPPHGGFGCVAACSAADFKAGGEWETEVAPILVAPGGTGHEIETLSKDLISTGLWSGAGIESAGGWVVGVGGGGGGGGTLEAALPGKSCRMCIVFSLQTTARCSAWGGAGVGGEGALSKVYVCGYSFKALLSEKVEGLESRQPHHSMPANEQEPRQLAAAVLLGGGWGREGQDEGRGGKHAFLESS